MPCAQPAKPFVAPFGNIDLNALLRTETELVAKSLGCRPVFVCWERALSERLATRFAAVIG
jgi:hypothetical protein